MRHIVVIPKKNGKLRIYIDFKKLNITTKKVQYPLPFTNAVLNIVGTYEAYSFLDGYLGYHQLFTNTRLHLLQIGGVLYGR